MQGWEVAQTMYTHVSKCKNDFKRKKEMERGEIKFLYLIWGKDAFVHINNY
jgi:hypothetical protein